MNLESVLAAYIEAALWSSNDESDSSGGVPLDRNYTAEDLAPETLERMRRDCAAFLRCVSLSDLAAYEDHAPLGYTSEERLGHDLWLTANRHGAGFWDRDWLPEGLGARLTDHAHALGETWLYVGADGQIHAG